MSAPVVEQLDQLTARRLVSQARNALAVADDVLERLFAGRAWEALGHADWPTLCAAELPELRHLKMRAEPRRARVAALLEHGATVRDIAAATGASVGQTHADIKALAPMPAGCATQLSSVARVVELVTAAGTRGLTIPQAQRRLGWTYGATSGALSRAERRGLLTRPLELPRRGGFRPYVTPENAP